MEAKTWLKMSSPFITSVPLYILINSINNLKTFLHDKFSILPVNQNFFSHLVHVNTAINLEPNSVSVFWSVNQP